VGEVDQKLVELARRTGAKIVTNDFNLNKVATVQGFSVLNVNQLANALKPAVLPGEPMRVLILREGKEPNQGVAYLDDGTMVVVDAARRMINKSVDVIVTSVHQTTAGKMIFGRLEERPEPPAPPLRQSAAAGAARGDGDGGTRTDATARIESSTRLPE
ncbi:MAG TPA: TRAM domain-containing protein, partial [Candidatus Acidoferrum sp.]|nr:TRAM domain-containing protein [Candidatus Acidoferrum sp.]